jgi:putative transposase
MSDFLQLKNRPLNKYSQSQETFMREEITKLLNTGLIEKSSSPVFSSPSVVPKPHSLKSRLVYDYRKVNAITNKIPTDSTTWESLTSKLSPSSNRFTTLDLTSAFHLIPLDPESRPYTSFLKPFGKYQFTVLPFGFSDSPAFFSQFLQTINFENNLAMLTYMDDCLIQSTQDLAVRDPSWVEKVPRKYPLPGWG